MPTCTKMMFETMLDTMLEMMLNALTTGYTVLSDTLFDCVMCYTIAWLTTVCSLIVWCLWVFLMGLYRAARIVGYWRIAAVRCLRGSCSGGLSVCTVNTLCVSIWVQIVNLKFNVKTDSSKLFPSHCQTSPTDSWFLNVSVGFDSAFWFGVLNLKTFFRFSLKSFQLFSFAKQLSAIGHLPAITQCLPSWKFQLHWMKLLMLANNLAILLIRLQVINLQLLTWVL